MLFVCYPLHMMFVRRIIQVNKLQWSHKRVAGLVSFEILQIYILTLFRKQFKNFIFKSAF